jgi:DNA-binding MarR family transcriptional regulator
VAPTPVPARDPIDRTRLIDELLDELTSHAPAGIMRYMRRWPSGPLSLVHLNVLTVLEIDGPLPMGAMAEALDVSQASATGIVDRMEQRGLVERRREDEDRRVIRVALTDDGRRLIEGVAEERRERLRYLLDELSTDELDGFLRGSRALRAARERLHAKFVSGEIPYPSAHNGTAPSTTPDRAEASR